MFVGPRIHTNHMDVGLRNAADKCVAISIKCYRGITVVNNYHYRGTPVEVVPITVVLPHILLPLPRIYHGYRSITAVPFMVQLSIADSQAPLVVPTHL